MSTIVGYLMPNPVYMYIYIQLPNSYFVDKIFKRAWTHLFVHS